MLAYRSIHQSACWSVILKAIWALGKARKSQNKYDKQFVFHPYDEGSAAADKSIVHDVIQAKLFIWDSVQ